MVIRFKGQNLHLHWLKGIFWEEEKILMIADLHLGKAAHFRKAGLAVPSNLLDTNLSNLKTLIDQFQPQRVLFLGDLFHSTINNVWEIFYNFLAEYPLTSFELVQGNHDILEKEDYENAELQVHPLTLEIGPFIFSHHPLEVVEDSLYNFYGHLHPGIQLSGWGGQNIKLPCFYFEQTQAVLPAFGGFTGLAMMHPKKGDQVFVIAEKEVMEVF